VKLGEAEAQLPNGLHDADLLSFKVDYEAKSAEFLFNAWVGDLDSKEPEIREKYQRARLRLHGVRFLVLEEPDPKYDFANSVPEIGGFSAWTGGMAPKESIKRLVEQLPPGTFYECTFVQNWNSFIHIGAEAAEVVLETK
jgi:hypothetical protein